jgi:hypothetical protein
VAVTDWVEFIVTWQEPAPEQAPLQPANVELWPAPAVSRTDVPLPKLATQLLPQLMPAGVLFTAPVPEPVRETDSTMDCAAGVVPIEDPPQAVRDKNKIKELADQNAWILVFIAGVSRPPERLLIPRGHLGQA